MAFFYLSQVLGRPVRTQAGDRVARVKDLVARLEALNAKGEVALEAYPPISGLVVEIEKRPIFVPREHIQRLGPDGVQLSSAWIDLRPFERREGEVLLARDILDKQLIDIDGRRVIRANDLQLYAADGTVRVTAVDVSGEALARRLTYGRLFGGSPAQTKPPSGEDRPGRLRRRRMAPARLIEWRDIEPLKAGVPDVRLRLSHERLAMLHPVDIAHIAEELSYQHGQEIIESLDDETAAETLQEMDEDRQADIVEGMDQERAADILEEMDPDDAADLLGDLDETQQQELLRRMDREEAEDVRELLAYEEESAGGTMTIEFITVPPRMTVDEVIQFMRTLDDAPDLIDYLYVVEEKQPGTAWDAKTSDQGGRLLGIVPLRDVLLSPGDRRLGDLMNPDFVWVRADDDRETAARLLADYNLLALPVLDEQDQLIGIITVDDAMEILVPDERWLHRIPRVFS
ncbi:MAG: magnesium transporter [Chloroflexi bacterium]|nr:magnesium transporter [Chloroflexota bacterium]